MCVCVWHVNHDDVYACECMWCVLVGEGSRVSASTDLVRTCMYHKDLWVDMYMTSYSDYLTGLHEPLLPPYIYLYTTPVWKMSSVVTVHSGRDGGWGEREYVCM